jgi:hypothetical protein
MNIRTLVWSGTDALRLEIARVRLDGAKLHATGTQIGVEPEAYELRYELTPTRLRAQVVGGAEIDLELGDRDAFDLGYSPLLNSMPILEHALHRGGEGRDLVMAWVSVPELAVHRSEQRYEPIGPQLVRFSDGDFTADLQLDEEGFVVRYPGLAERQYPPPP